MLKSLAGIAAALTIAVPGVSEAAELDPLELNGSGIEAVSDDLSNGEVWLGGDLTEALEQMNLQVRLSASNSADYNSENLSAYFIWEGPSSFTDPFYTDTPQGIRISQFSNPAHRADEAKFNDFWVGLSVSGSEDRRLASVGQTREQSEVSLALGGKYWLLKNWFVDGNLYITNQAYDPGPGKNKSYHYLGFSVGGGYQGQLTWSHLTNYAQEKLTFAASMTRNFGDDPRDIFYYSPLSYEYLSVGYGFFLPLCSSPQTTTTKAPRVRWPSPRCKIGVPNRLRMGISGTSEVGQLQSDWVDLSVGVTGLLGYWNAADYGSEAGAVHYSFDVGLSSYEKDESEIRWTGEDHTSFGGSQAVFQINGFLIGKRESSISLGVYRTEYRLRDDVDTWLLTFKVGKSK